MYPKRSVDFCFFLNVNVTNIPFQGEDVGIPSLFIHEIYTINPRNRSMRRRGGIVEYLLSRRLKHWKIQEILFLN
jgi:hypothetical protein